MEKKGMDVTSEEAVLRHIDRTIGRDPSGWTQWPNGWPGDIESALIDAVFSARAVYRSRNGRGVHSQVVEWQKSRRRQAWTTEALAKEIAAVTPEAWARQFGNSQLSPRRPTSAPGGATKAAAVLQAALALKGAGVAKADDINDTNAEEVKKCLRSIPGIGDATTSYFLMLLGRPGVKPDRMVHRFLMEATEVNWSNSAAEDLVDAVARLLNVTPTALDHAIWSYESSPSR